MLSVKTPEQKLKKEKIKKGKVQKTKTQLSTVKLQKAAPIPNNNIEEVNSVAPVKNDNKPRYTMPTQVVTENLVTSCLIALEKLTTHYGKKNEIFGGETQIFMEIRCIKISNSKANIKFVLPHSTVASSGEVCLITPDLKKGKKIDHEPTVEYWEDALKSAGVTSVKTVLPMRQLRVEYDQYELKRRLLTQHDFIMVANRVLSHVSHILGKKFFKKHNMLIPVKINEKKDLKKHIDIGLRTVMLRLSEGQTSTMLVGHTAMSRSQLKDNIMAVVHKLKEKFPGGEANIRALSIKLPLSLSLPLYITLRPSSSIATPKIKKTIPKDFITYEDELTTRPGSIVQVAPDGTVHLKKLNTRKVQKEYSNLEDEKESSDEDMSNDEE